MYSTAEAFPPPISLEGKFIFQNFFISFREFPIRTTVCIQQLDCRTLFNETPALAVGMYTAKFVVAATGNALSTLQSLEINLNLDGMSQAIGFLWMLRWRQHGTKTANAKKENFDEIENSKILVYRNFIFSGLHSEVETLDLIVTAGKVPNKISLNGQTVRAIGTAATKFELSKFDISTGKLKIYFGTTELMASTVGVLVSAGYVGPNWEQHIRVIVPVASLEWRPHGLMFWIFLFCHIAKIYKIYKKILKNLPINPYGTVEVPTSDKIDYVDRIARHADDWRLLSQALDDIEAMERPNWDTLVLHISQFKIISPLGPVLRGNNFVVFHSNSIESTVIAATPVVVEFDVPSDWLTIDVAAVSIPWSCELVIVKFGNLFGMTNEKFWKIILPMAWDILETTYSDLYARNEAAVLSDFCISSYSDPPVFISFESINLVVCQKIFILSQNFQFDRWPPNLTGRLAGLGTATTVERIVESSDGGKENFWKKIKLARPPLLAINNFEFCLSRASQGISIRVDAEGRKIENRILEFSSDRVLSMLSLGLTDLPAIFGTFERLKSIWPFEPLSEEILDLSHKLTRPEYPSIGVVTSLAVKFGTVECFVVSAAPCSCREISLGHDIQRKSKNSKWTTSFKRNLIDKSLGPQFSFSLLSTVPILTNNKFEFFSFCCQSPSAKLGLTSVVLSSESLAWNLFLFNLLEISFEIFSFGEEIFNSTINKFSLSVSHGIKHPAEYRLMSQRRRICQSNPPNAKNWEQWPVVQFRATTARSKILGRMEKFWGSVVLFGDNFLKNFEFPTTNQVPSDFLIFGNVTNLICCWDMNNCNLASVAIDSLDVVQIEVPSCRSHVTFSKISIFGHTHDDKPIVPIISTEDTSAEFLSSLVSLTVQSPKFYFVELSSCLSFIQNFEFLFSTAKTAPNLPAFVISAENSKFIVGPFHVEIKNIFCDQSPPIARPNIQIRGLTVETELPPPPAPFLPVMHSTARPSIFHPTSHLVIARKTLLVVCIPQLHLLSPTPTFSSLRVFRLRIIFSPITLRCLPSWISILNQFSVPKTQSFPFFSFRLHLTDPQINFPSLEPTDRVANVSPPAYKFIPNISREESPLDVRQTYCRPSLSMSQYLIALCLIDKLDARGNQVVLKINSFSFDYKSLDDRSTIEARISPIVVAVAPLARICWMPDVAESWDSSSLSAIIGTSSTLLRPVLRSAGNVSMSISLGHKSKIIISIPVISLFCDSPSLLSAADVILNLQIACPNRFERLPIGTTRPASVAGDPRSRSLRKLLEKRFVELVETERHAGLSRCESPKDKTIQIILRIDQATYVMLRSNDKSVMSRISAAHLLGSLEFSFDRSSSSYHWDFDICDLLFVSHDRQGLDGSETVNVRPLAVERQTLNADPAHGQAVALRGVFRQIDVPEIITQIIFVESLLIQIAPIEVKLTTTLVDEIYKYFFPNFHKTNQVEDDAMLADWMSHSSINDSLGTSPPAPCPNSTVSLVFVKFARVCPIETKATFVGGPMRFVDVPLRFSSFVVENKLSDFQELIDRFLWMLGRQTTATLLSQKFRDFVARRKSSAEVDSDEGLPSSHPVAPAEAAVAKSRHVGRLTTSIRTLQRNRRKSKFVAQYSQNIG